ncbi:PhoX family protein [Marinobacter salarius]|jgi:secreted PhoX family phosphatase|uniref:PhoX family protein n=1 Tax=Marinobacter salarius TaxID=1420917 RepID=UPI0010AB47EA|nr:MULTISPECIES: PhoX family phosphatase [Marinobacter]MBJ7299149.1 PhoX family phosphatase [Marinobacter salarius]HIO28644.1 PhoX family phosphatase [Marinobacter salarius]HIP00478.1 PhoX family phosphatase [Marinobacter salarius]
MAKHDLDPNYLDPNYEPVVNHSSNTPFHQVLAARMQRRTVMKGSVGAALASVMGLGLAGCGSDDDDDNGSSTGGSSANTDLGFKAVAVSTANEVVVPEGYSSVAFLPWGTPITGSYPEYKADGTNTGADQEQQMGMHHDGVHFFPIDQKAGGNSSTEGLLVMNHEYINQSALHANGPTNAGDNGGVRPADEVRKEIAAHGVSVVHIKRDTNGTWDVVFGSPFNRRITGNTEMDIRGPVRGYSKLVTTYSPDATETRGTLNNCAMGPTPWGTYLAAEENWHGYFANSDATQPREQTRHGVGSSSRYDWELADSAADQYVRFNVSTTGAAATDDYRNEANTYGFMVEIDPFTPESKPQKRTALGRFGHEGVIFAPAKEGEPVVCYSGDDSRFEYIYKFVSSQPYYAATAGGYLLDEGTLYVARFNEDGSGDWLALDLDDADFASKVAAAEGGMVGDIQFDGFENQADVLLNTRLAADIAGATTMDRPEWGAVDPNSGEVYFTLTNNSNRGQPGFDDVNAANPNSPNATGHIIRWTEEGSDHTATSFDWDIFVFAGEQGTETVVDGEAVVSLNDDNIFNSPDGLWFDYNGRLWIQTDGSDADPYFNNMMLAANPETREIKRFFVGPQGCEVTGVVSTPDVKTMFVNIQHPDGNWPNAAESRPRDATVIVTKDDGGVIGA